MQHVNQHANMYIIFKENIFSTIGFTQSENYTDNSADDQPVRYNHHYNYFPLSKTR
jgi:hypothetical protein